MVIVGTGVFVLPALVLALINGLGAINARWYATDSEQARTLRYLAINQLEPVVNTFLMGAAAILFFIEFIDTQYPPLVPLFATLPMMVLFLPLRGLLKLHNPAYRRFCLLLGLNGLARWSTTVALFTVNPLSLTSLAFGFIAFVIGIGLLWASLLWGRSLLNGPLRTFSISTA